MILTHIKRYNARVSTTMGATNFRKLRLILWKNWLLQWRHKVQTVIELLLPIVSVLLLIMMRSLINIRDFNENSMYFPVPIDNLQDLRYLEMN